MTTTKTIVSSQKVRVSRLFELLHGIDLCSGITGSFGFSYALGRSKKIIMDQAKSIEEMNRPEPEFEAFQRERQELIETKLAKKTGDQIEFTDASDGSGKVPVFKNPESAELELDTLVQKHAVAIEKRKAMNRAYIKFYNEESIDIDLYLIKKEHLPEDKLTPGMVYAIYELIEETE
jgi:hypothetical protein